LSITSVSVNGKTYAATEKSGDVVIRSDGKLNVEAEAFAGGDVFEVTVSSEGYEDLQFIYIVGDSQEKLLRQLPKNSGEQSVPLVNDIVERSWIKENIKESSSPVISRSLEQTEDNGRATWTYRISRKIRIPAGK
ncbi:MAG: hemoblobin-interacting domain-containing protein, partial [Brotaphodocola sp.]